MKKIKAKILIVEDELIIAMHLGGILENLGCEVVDICGSAVEAITAYQEKKPDLLFVDIMLAGNMTGIDMVTEIKKRENVPIIYLTSNTDEATFEAAKKTFPEAFLRKPFNEFDLKTTLVVALHRFYEEQKHQKEASKKNVLQKVQINELTETNAHLITATWRERELKKELQKTKDQLELQNKRILDSINYAKRIQKAIIPKLEDIRKDLPNTDWFYKPKDVVSGDFPYYYRKGDLIYYAAVDCTGHGVPGAMMSLIGYLLLNEILNDTVTYSPAEVLLKLHQGVVKTLKQDFPKNKAADGMDVGICCYNIQTKKLEYSGAHRPLYLVRSGEEDVIQYKGGKYPIGGNQYRGKNTFPNHEIDLVAGDVVYFFSDGYPDQFGGNENLKLGPKRIRKLLAKNASKSIGENINILAKNFDEWMGNDKQIDDVLMIGVQF